MRTPKELLYHPSRYVVYYVPPLIKPSMNPVLELLAKDLDFKKTLRINSKVNNVFNARIDYYLHGNKPPEEEWEWRNTDEATRKYILESVLNHGECAYAQYCRLRVNVKYLENYEEKSRAVAACARQLVRASALLNAFGSLDDKLHNAREKIIAQHNAGIDINQQVVRIVEMEEDD